MAVLALNTSSHRNAVSRLHRDGFAGNVARPVARTAGVGGADHLGHQRRTPAELAERATSRSSTISTCSRSGATASPSRTSGSRWTIFPDEELFEAHRRRKRRLVGFVRARQVQSATRRQAPAAEIRRAGEVLDPERLHHRVLPPFRHLQARHADLPRRGAAEEDPVQPRPAGADHYRRQGASQGLTRARP